MKDNIQNIADLIGALAEDIEEVKKQLDTKDSSDKYEELKRLAVKLEPVIQFFNGNAPENVNAIFGSKEAIEEYKKSLGDEIIASLYRYNEANDKEMRKQGVPTIRDMLHKILEMQKGFAENTKQTAEQPQPIQGFLQQLWLTIRPGKALNVIKRLWNKVPDGWNKSPYTWTAICCTLVFITLFVVSWVQWHKYREENMRLRTVADKHQVISVMLNELYPELAVTVGAYEKLVDAVGVDSTLAVFNRQVKSVRKENNQTKKIDK